jgi:hypothetical protein
MNTMSKLFFNLIIISFLGGNIQSQVVLDKQFSKDSYQHVVIANMSGSIDVQPSSDEYIHIKAVCESGKVHADLSLDWFTWNNFVKVYLRTPCSISEDKMQVSEEDPFSFRQWESNCDWDSKEENPFPVFNFEIKIPKGVRIYTSTILEGDISIKGIRDQIYATNINGDILLESVDKITKAHTVNGDVEITYRSLPQSDGELETLNGDIKISMDSGADFTVLFSSFMGEMYTDFDDLEITPRIHKKSVSEDGFKFSLKKEKEIKIGAGGPVLSIQTFNGDVIISKN